MSIKQMTIVFNDETIKGNEKLLMLALADNANDSGVSFPSWNELMRKTSMSRNSLAKWLLKLEEMGLIFRKQRSRKNGSKTSNKFLIYPMENRDKLDHEDIEIFEDMYPKYQNSDYPQSTKSVTTTVPKGELGMAPKVPKGELLEPSLIINHQFNHHYNSATKIANMLFEKIKSVLPTFKKPNIDLWAKDIEKAIRIDGRTEEQLKDCIDWIYSNEGQFWQKNILSGAKLREKFDTMNMQVVTKKFTMKDALSNGILPSDIFKARGEYDDVEF